MPRPLVLVIGILLFAMATVFVYVWGIIKQRNQAGDLSKLLYSKGTAKIKKYLKKHETATEKELEELMKGLRASLFYSRNQAVVQDTGDFVRQLTSYMLEYHLLLKENSNGKIVYRLNK